tara:strand:+ start:1278 stop:1706 length:429 start_codon:yes stop_codon:yes gene_type:complete
MKRRDPFFFSIAISKRTMGSRKLSGPAKAYKSNLEAILNDLGVEKRVPKKGGPKSRMAGLHKLAMSQYRKDYDKDKKVKGKAGPYNHKPYGSKSSPNTTHPLYQYNKAMKKVIRELLAKQSKYPKVPKGKSAKKHLLQLARK